MDYRVDINKGKWFDVRKTTEIFEALKKEAETYCKNSDATGAAYQNFVISEAFKGQSADATKNFVGNGMGKMNSDIKEAVIKCLKNQEDVLVGFSEMVDSSPNAYIDYNTLKVIDEDFDGYYTNFKSIAQSVDYIINLLNNEFGKEFGEFAKPDKSGVQKAFNDMCGAESGGGYIKECRDKFISFDSALADHVRTNDTAEFLDDITGKIGNATKAFSAGEAMPINLNNVNVKAVVDASPRADAGLYDDIGECGGDHKHMGEGLNWGLGTLSFGVTDEDDGLFDYVKQHSLYDCNPEVHDYLLDTTSFDVAAGNILLDQSMKYSDEDFKNHVGFSRIRNGDFDFRTITTDYRLKSDKKINIDKAVGVEAYIQEKCFYYRDHMDEFNEAYPNIKLLDEYGNFTYKAREIFGNETRDIDYPEIYSYYDSSAIMLNKLSRYCDEVNYNMDYKRLGKYSINPSSAEIALELKSGRSVVFQAENIKLRKKADDSEGMISGPEELTVISVPSDDMLEVSYMGESWFLSLNKQNNDAKMNDFYSVLITDRTPITSTVNNKTEADLFNEVKDGIGYEIYDELQPDPYKPLDKIDEVIKKVGPAYEARLNVIFDKYEGREEEFEQKYGIKYYADDGTRNIRILMYKLYMETGDAITIDFWDPMQIKKYAAFRRSYYLQNPDKYEEKYESKLFVSEGTVNKEFNEICEREALEKKYEYDSKGERVVTVHAGGPYLGEFTREDLNKRFAAFANNHGDSASVVPLMGISKKDRMEELFANDNKPTFEEVREAMLADGIPTNSEIKYMLDHGYEVVFKLTGTKYLEDKNGTQGLTGARELNADEATIRDIAPDGRYIVVVDGKEYYFDAAKYNKYCAEYYAVKA